MHKKKSQKKSTEPLPFYLENGSSIRPETMQWLDTLPYMKNDLFSAVQLAYGKGNYNMFI